MSINRQLCQCLRPALNNSRSLSIRQPLRTQQRLLRTSTQSHSRNGPRKPLQSTLLSSQQSTYGRRVKYSAAGIAACAVAMYALIKIELFPVQPQLNDAPPSKDFDSNAPPVILDGSQIPKIDGEEGVEQIPTGTSTIPTFPKLIHLSPTSQPPSGALPAGIFQGSEEYQLIGLGIRTVSFLSIQVYVVGLYIAVSDIATLQERLIRLVDPVATTLVPGERGKLRELLMDPTERGEEVWSQLLKMEGLRTAIRIVPTRNTDFMHLRDGWVRGITGRTQKAGAAGSKEFEDESFGEAVRDFKGIFGGGARKSVPKGKTLLLTRNAKGEMSAWYEEEGKPILKLGGVRDERISRLVWMGYLAGKSVASEGARRSVVDGVMEFVERPVGTVATQVV